MKSLKLIIIFIACVQIFATPLMSTCDMSSLLKACCSPYECECDEGLPEKIDAVKQQVQFTAYDFIFDYDVNSHLESIVICEIDNSISVESYNSFSLSTAHDRRAVMQIFIL